MFPSFRGLSLVSKSAFPFENKRIQENQNPVPVCGQTFQTKQQKYVWQNSLRLDK